MNNKYLIENLIVVTARNDGNRRTQFDPGFCYVLSHVSIREKVNSNIALDTG